jgi:hypothetical protein
MTIDLNETRRDLAKTEFPRQLDIATTSDYGGARAWLKANSPLVHHVGMEYHEFSTLFILPLGVACTWILWQYGDSILEKQHRPVLTATCVALMGMMFFAMGGLVSELAVAKIHAL